VNAVGEGRSPLEAGVLVTLAAFGIAGALGLIAVFDTDEVASAFGAGFGIAWAIGLAGATVAAGLACLKRRRLELVALGSVVAAGLAIDLLVLAILADIDSEGYGKVTAVVFVWSFFALVALGLTLAVGSTSDFGRLLYFATLATAVIAALIATWLIATAGDDGFGSVDPFGVVPGGTLDDELLRVLGACFVALSALWFATLAATRVERRPASDVEAHV
jgi:hypothetical protein